MLTYTKYLSQIPRMFAPPPKSKSVMLHFLYRSFTMENPTVGTTESTDSPAKFFAATVFPALSSPTNNTVMFLQYKQTSY